MAKQEGEGAPLGERGRGLKCRTAGTCIVAGKTSERPGELAQGENRRGGSERVRGGSGLQGRRTQTLSRSLSKVAICLSLCYKAVISLHGLAEKRQKQELQLLG